MPEFASRKEQVLDIMAKKILAALPAPGEHKTAIKNLFMIHRHAPMHASYCLSRPMAGVIVDGRKKFDVNGHEIFASRGECLVTCIETPNSSSLLETDPPRPFLSVFFLLDKTILAELAAELRFPASEEHRNLLPLNVLPAHLDFLETFLRLLELCNRPEHIQGLAPLIMKELHFLLLAGPQGKMLRELYLKGSRDNRIMEAIAWLKANSKSSVSIDALAKRVNMSVSSLHRHFKEVTGYSPLQYHKQLRLYEAQRLMLAENERADRAAMAVGYESITQFNREYKRMFGLPPHKDILKRKSSL